MNSDEQQRAERLLENANQANGNPPGTPMQNAADSAKTRADSSVVKDLKPGPTERAVRRGRE
jgi:hypothetical protein